MVTMRLIRISCQQSPSGSSRRVFETQTKLFFPSLSWTLCWDLSFLRFFVFTDVDLMKASQTSGHSGGLLAFTLSRHFLTSRPQISLDSSQKTSVVESLSFHPEAIVSLLFPSFPSLSTFFPPLNSAATSCLLRLWNQTCRGVKKEGETKGSWPGWCDLERRVQRKHSVTSSWTAVILTLRRLEGAVPAQLPEAALAWHPALRLGRCPRLPSANPAH